MYKYLILLLLFTTLTYADEISFSYGLGAFSSAKKSMIETVAINANYRQMIGSGFYWSYKAGFWLDRSDPRQGRKGSFFLSSGPGILIDLHPFEIRNSWGLAYVSTPDSYLGGNFPQFNGELYLGLRDSNNNGVGIKYEHISSAGLVMPNVGRDFLMLEISKRW